MLNVTTTSSLQVGFESLNLILPLCRAVREENYVHPTPIQVQAIPHLLQGRDLLGCAQTGTGKTGAFALPILQRLAEKPNRPAVPRGARALILSPTRELAQQIHESFEVYGRHLRFRQAVVFGGMSYQPQIRALSRGVDILVATPGRLMDLIEQGHLRLNHVETFVLDEADRMLDMGFLPAVRRIFAQVPPHPQSMLFSATLPEEIVKLSRAFLKDPVQVTVSPSSTTVERIDQRVLFVDREKKGELLESLLQDHSVERALVFTRTKHGANRIVKNLVRGRIQAEAIHGNKSQAARLAALKKFRNGQARVLVATDIASRGLDVDGITHVINYELPHEPESYVHRIGRTARAGASGIAISLCDAGEHVSLRQIEKTICRSVTVFEDHPYHSHAVASMGRKSHAGNGAGHNRPAGHSARKPNPGRPNRFGGKNRGSSPKFRGRARAGR